MTMVDATAAPFQADVCAVPIKEGDDDVSPVIEVIWDVEELELESVPISGRECLSPTSPVELENDVFYDCETPLKSEEQAKKTFNLLVPFQPSATPSFSSLASPRGVRRKIKRFLFAFSPESIGRTEEFVALMGQGWTEDRLFHHLHKEFTPSDGGRSSCSKQVAERDETLTETLLQCFTELNIGDSNSKSTTVTKLCVQFSESVLAIRTDVSGLPLGPEVTVLKEPHVNTKELTPQVAPTLGPNGMRRRRKEKKRRMPRLSHEDKLALYEWRTDLQSDKFLIKHLKRLSEQKLAEQQSAVAMAAAAKKSAPTPSGTSLAEAAQPPSAPFAVSRSPLSLPSYPLWSRAPKPKTRISKSKETLSETGKGLQGVHNNTELTRHNRLGGHMSIV